MEHARGHANPLQSIENGIVIRELPAMACSGPVGHHVCGSRRGPVLLVMGHERVMESVYRRILALPNLPWIRGELILAKLIDGQPGLDSVILDSIAMHCGPIDDTLHLIGDAENAQELYWTILRFCTQYGMITGRGVPRGHPGLQLVPTASDPERSGL